MTPVAVKAQKTRSLCKSFGQYAKIAKVFANDQSMSEKDVEVVSSRFIMQSSEFQSLSPDRKDAWMKFMSHAARWAYQNRETENFYDNAVKECEQKLVLAKREMMKRVISCQALSEVATLVYPVYKKINDAETAKVIIRDRLSLDEDREALLDAALEMVSLHDGGDEASTANKVYQSCLTN